MEEVAQRLGQVWLFPAPPAAGDGAGSDACPQRGMDGTVSSIVSSEVDARGAPAGATVRRSSGPVGRPPRSALQERCGFGELAAGEAGRPEHVGVRCGNHVLSPVGWHEFGPRGS
jgi:hypothetical protein